MNESVMKDPVFPLSYATDGSAGTTGDWRTSTPKLDPEECSRCNRCWLSCPEAVISHDSEGFPVIDYRYCKGCLVCVHECPKDAMKEGPTEK